MAAHRNERLGEIEEDDEFEDFATDDWTKADEDPEDAKLWEDNWDTENIDDEFSRQLRAELKKAQAAAAQNQQQQQPGPQQ
ncbi:DSS1/SEM1 family-domain-containing protein [Cladochytrium replicatum]|nr:DSS1/SEM1 family-domain-containing protein [Cladochytrium replicatum]